MAAHEGRPSPGRLPPSAGSEASDYSDYGSELSLQSTLADLLERFTVDAQPECTLKLRATAGPVVLGGDLTRVTGVGSTVGALVLKPARGDPAWRRVRLDSGGALTLRSRKLRWWLFTLDLTAHANPLTKSLDLSYRVATKWDVARGEYRNKRRLELGANTEARAHWSIAYSLPAVEGSMGAAAQRVSREVHADVGYAHLSIPRVELVVWPRGRPADGGGAGARSEGGGAGDAACAGGAAEADAGPARGSEQAPPAAPGLGAVAPGPGEGRAAAARHGAAAGLQQLNSHVACLSGRWWETFGGRQR